MDKRDELITKLEELLAITEECLVHEMQGDSYDGALFIRDANKIKDEIAKLKKQIEQEEVNKLPPIILGSASRKAYHSGLLQGAKAVLNGEIK